MPGNVVDGVGGVADAEREGGDAAAPRDELEGTERLDLLGEPLGRVAAGLLHLAVSVRAEAQEVVVLGHDLGART